MNNRKHKEEVLINVYNIETKKVQKLNDEELEKMLLQKERDKMTISRNPNKFGYIKGMPIPKEYETKTSKFGGAFVVGMLFLILLGFLALFITMALIANK